MVITFPAGSQAIDNCCNDYNFIIIFIIIYINRHCIMKVLVCMSAVELVRNIYTEIIKQCTADLWLPRDYLNELRNV